jgi:hypothetical protein
VHRLKTVAVFSNSQATIRRTAYLELRTGKQSERQSNWRPQALPATSVATEIHWVLELCGIPRKEELDRQANLARNVSGHKVIERPYTTSSNRARRISKARSTAMAKWKTGMCSNHFRRRQKGKMGTKRPVPMTSVKSLVTRFYRLNCQHAPAGVYRKQFGHREADK